MVTILFLIYLFITLRECLKKNYPKIYSPVQLRRYFAIFTVGLLGFQASQSQTLDTDKLPTRPLAEKVVLGSAALPDFALQATATPKADEVALPKGDEIVRTALQYIGVRYRSGQSSPSGFDCSGLTSYVFRQEGIKLNRSSRAQYTQGVPVAKKSDLKKGDLVFFGGSRSTRSVGHVGIVVDVDPANNQFKFVHASSSSGVKVSNSSESYYSRRYIGARRVLGTQE